VGLEGQGVRAGGGVDRLVALPKFGGTTRREMNPERVCGPTVIREHG
jgi:hypothetical protein